VVVGSSVQVQEDSDDEEGQDEQQQAESVPSQQQGQQDKVKWCCKHCQRVLSGKNEDRMKKHLLNPRACKILDSFLPYRIVLPYTVPYTVLQQP